MPLPVKRKVMRMRKKKVTAATGAPKDPADPRQRQQPSTPDAERAPALGGEAEAEGSPNNRTVDEKRCECSSSVGRDATKKCHGFR